MHNTIYAAAKRNSTPEMRIPRSTLADFINQPPNKPFQAKRGKTSTAMTPSEEAEMKRFVTKRAELGCGLSLSQLHDDDDDDVDCLTDYLRVTMSVSKARALVSLQYAVVHGNLVQEPGGLCA